MAKLSEVICEPTGQYLTDSERRQRLAIESRHADDDGTMRLARRLERGRAIYANNENPPDDDAHFSELELYGLSFRAVQRFEKAGMETIRDLREHLAQITEWKQCGDGMRREAEAALERLRKARNSS